MAATEDAQAEKDPKHIYNVMKELGLRRQIVPGAPQALKLGVQDSRNQEQLGKIVNCFTAELKSMEIPLATKTKTKTNK